MRAYAGQAHILPQGLCLTGKQELRTTGGIAKKLAIPRDQVAYATRVAGLSSAGFAGLTRMFDNVAVSRSLSGRRGERYGRVGNDRLGRTGNE